MKNTLLALFVAILTVNASAQVTLEHTYGPLMEGGKPVLFSSNGTKYVANDSGSNTIKLYNTDHSLWKSIPVPVPAGYKWLYTFLVSDNFFNTDNQIEAFVSWYQMGVSPIAYKCAVISESGSVLHDLGNGFYATPAYIDGSHKLMVLDPNGASFTKVYSVPGELPCGHCDAAGVGVPKVGMTTGSIAPTSVPNPGTGDVKVFYTLPENVYDARIVLSGIDGKIYNSYPVSAATNYITIDVSGLVKGMYIYTLSGDGMLPLSGKLTK